MSFLTKDEKLFKKSMKCKYGVISIETALKKQLIAKQSTIKKN